jgi:hypothetical protein
MKMPLKTHIGLHLFFLATKTPGRQVLFDVLPITEPCALIFSSVWTVIVVLHASHLHGETCPPKHNCAISTLPDKTNTWEMNHF